jgi:hypothetical protein
VRDGCSTIGLWCEEDVTRLVVKYAGRIMHDWVGHWFDQILSESSRRRGIGSVQSRVEGGVEVMLPA